MAVPRPARSIPARALGLRSLALRPLGTALPLALPLALMLQVPGGAPVQAGGGGVTISSYGHSALLIQGGGARVLINPFRAVGCAAGLAEPRVGADVILASSQLPDEGATGVGSGRYLVKPGSYRVAGLAIEGIATPHDRHGGRRFGYSTLWRWRQGGLEFAHLGGTAGPIAPEDRVLLGRPDVLILGVGGGAKVYTGSEAAAVVQQLRPARVIPVQYRPGGPTTSCDLESAASFQQALPGVPVRRVGSSLSLVPPLAGNTEILLMR